MSSVALSFVSVAVLCGQYVLAQSQSTFPATPLVSKHFASPTDVPYKVDTDTNLIRGQQFGFNICNSTTQNQNSNCQTSYINSIDNFCLWAPPEPNSEVFDKEGEMVAWCTTPKYGTRLFPKDALLGVQFMRTSDYVQVVGFIDQSKINLISGHPGGEMDPGGADLRGNPLGGLVFSNAWSGGDANKYTQAQWWHNFMGNDQFCFKACDPSKPNAAHFCEHIYDRIGCEINAPNNAQKGVFESCDGDVQDFPGTYTGTDGAVTTYKQPAESLGPITAVPYVARTPSSSNCKTFDSSSLYAALASVTASGAPSSAITTSSAAATTGISSKPATNSPTTSAPAPSSSNAGETLAISAAASLFGVFFAAIFFS